MKTMTCQQLGGACSIRFSANTFEEIAELSRQHGMLMLQKKDTSHIEAMHKMQALMKDPNAMQTWLKNKQKEFDGLPKNTKT